MIVNKKIHLIGIGGAGMSGIASILMEMGNQVTGSDIKESPVIERLRLEGIKIHIGHKKENINDPDIVVVSSVISVDNEEYQAVMNLKEQKNISVLKRAQALAMLTQGKETIVVGGTHGKTSTTALIVSALERSGENPSYVIGGEFEENSLNSKLGNGNSFVLEADESDGSIVCFAADIGVITNVEEDHLDYYGSLSKIEEMFCQFIRNSSTNSCFYFCADDPSVRKVVSDAKRKLVSFAIEAEADMRAVNIEITNNCSVFDVVFFGETLGRIKLNIPGKHNILNALPAIAIAYQKGVAFSEIQEAMQASFRVKRRLEVKYQNDKVILIDDYAHHPTEIKMTLETLRTLSYKRLLTVFQPHRYTRLKFLFDEFCDAFKDTDILVLADVYSASEQEIDGISTEKLYEKMKKKYPLRDIVYFKTQQEIIRYLEGIIKEQDMVAVLGAGDINDIVIPLKDFFSHRLAC